MNFIDDHSRYFLDKRGVDKIDFYKKLAGFNKERRLELTPTEVLYWTMERGIYVFASQIYPFVIEELEDRKKKELYDAANITSAEIDVLKRLYEVMKNVYAPSADRRASG